MSDVELKRSNGSNVLKKIEQYILPVNKKWFNKLSEKDIAEILNKFAHASQSIPHMSVNPVKKGQIGENFIYNTLVKLYGTECVELKIKDKYSSDIMITLNCNTIIIEVKNYTGKVPTHQINKFIRDCETTNANSGLFVSLNSGISLKKGNMVFEDVVVNGSKIPVIYINLNGVKDNIDKYLYLLVNVLTVTVKAYKKVSNDSCVNFILKEMKETLNMVTNNRYDLSKAKNIMTQSLDKIILKNVSVENRLRLGLDFINNLIDRKE